VLADIGQRFLNDAEQLQFGFAERERCATLSDLDPTGRSLNR
jgi:hypothetical protein